jgi:diguanylate cyclase (GGDEF)-like protein/PAS domain S-box-containing protein
VNLDKPFPVGDATEEIVALIATLHDAGQRLEELTGGEVDTVADRDGRPFMLRRPQEQLRSIEAAKQAAILNSLPAQIAVLDSQGLILSVNEAWRQFEIANEGRGPSYDVGLNYFKICDGARGDGATKARQAADGIRSVLGRTAKSFSIEYPSHSVTQPHWFLLTATSMADDHPHGAVIRRLDVTAERLAEESLLASELRFRQMAENISDVFFLESLDGSEVLYVSPSYERIWGRTCASLYASPGSWAQAIHPEDVAGAFPKRAGSSEAGFENEFRIVRPDGEIRWIHVRGFPIMDEAGKPYRIAGVCTDITRSRLSMDELRASERRFSDVLQNVELISVMLDREARITYCNEYFLRLTGWRREEIMGRSWVELFMAPEVGGLDERFAALLADQPAARHGENTIVTRSGERRLIRWNNSVLRSAAGEVTGWASLGEDITEQKSAEVSVKRLNRVYAMLSGINTLIVRVRARDELFREACRIAVESGQFAKAWIGMVDRGSQHVTLVAAHGGDPAFFPGLEAELNRKLQTGEGILARVLSTQLPVVSNDMARDPDVLLKDHSATGGARSLAMLPLVVAGDVVGVFTLNADVVDFFDEEEMKLLLELAGDVAFAIDHLGKQEQLDHLAYYDALTGLANRTLFLERLATYMRSAASAGHKLALFFIDIERFRNVNDSLGRAAGDAILKQVAQWLALGAGGETLLARVGADQFVALLPVVRKGGSLPRFLEKMIAAFLGHSFGPGESALRLGIKVGLAVYPEDGVDSDTLFTNAEAALKKAKASGERYVFYTQNMTANRAGKLTLENQLRLALDKEEFVLNYQPKVELAGGKLTGAEALIRWNDPRTGLVPPGRFIPVLEETGLIYDVGRWAMHQALKDYLRWLAAGLPAVRIAVNVSPLQLRNRGFVDEVRKATDADALAAAGLEIEITESVIMEDVKLSIASLQAIRETGVTVAIDDFGTGFSSLSHLSRLPVDTLKIDRTFVVDMTVSSQGLALVSTIINLAHSLKLEVVAEGVETEEQARLLRLLDCDQMQGFLYSKPVPVGIFEERFLAPAGDA